jgi:nuclear cap-binding protein subunit 1
MLSRVAQEAQDAIEGGKWREFKLLLRFFACLQGVLEGDGIFPILDELFDRAVDFQAASASDAVGYEFVKIILLTLPYALASTATGLESKALELLERTSIIAESAVDHELKDVVNPFPTDSDEKPYGYESALNLLQQQMKRESETGWKFSCIPRLYQKTKMDSSDLDSTATKHGLPQITIPSPPNPGVTTFFPEAYFSIYVDQEFEVWWTLPLSR